MHHLLLSSERALLSVFLKSRSFGCTSYICIIQKEYWFSASDTSSSFRKLGSRGLSNLVSCNKDITSYIRSGDLDSAVQVFLGMKIRSTVTWNSLLAGLSTKPGKLKEAEDLFGRIPEPDTVSYNVMLSAYLNNASLDAAMDFFDRIPSKDIASWNTMISGYLKNGKVDDAEKLFSVMPRRNLVTWNAMVSGYAEVGDMESALCFLERAPVKDVVAWTSIVTGYMKRGMVELAEKFFQEIPSKNLVTWNTMISGYVENGRGEDGLRLFKQMLVLGMKPSPSTFSSILLACSSFSLLKFGKLVHQLTLKSPLYYSGTTIGTSLVSMYCKCGVLEDGWKLFTEMQHKDIVTWNAMISGYAQHGFSDRALYLFNEMRAGGTKPNWITFVGILSACNHAGLVDLGKQYFQEMQKDLGIRAEPDHYTCMVDLFSRAGRLEEAMDLIKNMPFQPHPAIYGTLLGACRIHNKLEIAEFAAANLLHLEPANPAAYVQLANVYAVKKNWGGVSRVWRSMKENRVMKTPGCTWVEIKSRMHEFRSGDRLHPELEIIHNKLRELESKMKLAGYVPHLESSLHDIAEEQKEELLLWHSEKLAIAYALIKVPPSEGAIRVFKNLRVCQDCHVATKFITAVENREIIVRDTTRFHHFRHGKCSCGDYW